jgi:hypothetical protein
MGYGIMRIIGGKLVSIDKYNRIFLCISRSFNTLSTVEMMDKLVDKKYVQNDNIQSPLLPEKKGYSKRLLKCKFDPTTVATPTPSTKVSDFIGKSVKLEVEFKMYDYDGACGWYVKTTSIDYHKEKE